MTDAVLHFASNERGNTGIIEYRQKDRKEAYIALTRLHNIRFPVQTCCHCKSIA